MGLQELVKAAMELGVIPALSLFLVLVVVQQNRQLLKDRREMESRLLEQMFDIMKNYQSLLDPSQRPRQRR